MARQMTQREVIQMARAAATNTGYPGVEKRGNSIRVFFMYKRVRHTHTLPLEPSRNNIKHAVQVRSAALFALKNGSYNETDFFPHSRSAESTAPGERLGELRVDLIATRAVSTVNHYLATFSGFLYWCENNRYCGELGKHRTRFTMSILGPGPMTYEEYQTSKWRNLIRRAEIRSRPPPLSDPAHLCLLEPDGSGQPGLYREPDGTQGLFHARDRLWPLDRYRVLQGA